jgi:hypothetical protein
VVGGQLMFNLKQVRGLGTENFLLQCPMEKGWKENKKCHDGHVKKKFDTHTQGHSFFRSFSINISNSLHLI